MAEAVIGGPLLRVLQDVVGLVDFLELGLGRLVAGIGIGMELLGELADRRLFSSFSSAPRATPRTS